MKNKEKTNFTKLTQKKGISLIVLVITIIVIIILSAVVVMTVSLNNPLSSANEAIFKEDISNFKTELEVYKAEMQVRKEKPENLNASKDTEPSIKDIITNITNKYEKVLEIRNGKLVYVGKDKKQYRLAYDMEILPDDELLDDNILEELKPCITEWTVSDNDSITLPVGGTYNFTVDYGDGTGEHKVTSDKDEYITHTYEKAGTYTVTIKGNCGSFDTLYHGKNTRGKLTKIIQWGTLGAYSIKLSSCSNLTGPIPEPSKNSFINLTSAWHMFFGCNKLQCEIPEKLFFNAPKITDFNMTFSNCGFIGAIPEKLFSKCPNVTSFNSVFRENNYIEGPIPENLFANNTEVIDFAWAFKSANKVSGEFPTNLFKNNLKATNFEYCFFYHSDLTGEAPALWERENVTNYSYCFHNCTNLSNYDDIPESWK